MSHSNQHSPLPDGVREAVPAVLMLFAIALPIGLITLAAIGGGLALTALALAAMVVIVAAGGAYVEHLTAPHPDGEDRRE